VARIGGRRDAQRFSIGKPELKRLLGRPRSEWKGNIKNIFREQEDDEMN
jgi:hypothetical protein